LFPFRSSSPITGGHGDNEVSKLTEMQMDIADNGGNDEQIADVAAVSAAEVAPDQLDVVEETLPPAPSWAEMAGERQARQIADVAAVSAAEAELNQALETQAKISADLVALESQMVDVIGIDDRAVSQLGPRVATASTQLRAIETRLGRLKAAHWAVRVNMLVGQFHDAFGEWCDTLPQASALETALGRAYSQRGVLFVLADTIEKKRAALQGKLNSISNMRDANHSLNAYEKAYGEAEQLQQELNDLEAEQWQHIVTREKMQTELLALWKIVGMAQGRMSTAAALLQEIGSPAPQVEYHGDRLFFYSGPMRG
jgi:hypothetical protein